MGLVTPLQTELKAWASALMFLTRFPLPQIDYQPELLGRSVLYFPLVGVLVGLASAAVYWLAAMWWSTPIACALALLTAVLSTGGFHEDGLADTADGIGGGWTVQDKLKIMKDSQIGTFGVLALTTTLLIKFAALSSMQASTIPIALILGHALGRWSILPIMRLSAYVGAESGLGRSFINAVTPWRLLLSTAFVTGLMLQLLPGKMLLISLSVLLLLGVCRWFYQRSLGGITGDTLGATIILVETTTYLAIAANLQS